MSTSQSLQQPHQQHPPPTAATVPANTAADTKHSGSLLYPTPLTPVQESLSQGTLMCYCAQVLPKESYITAVEEACTRLLPRVAEGIQSSFQPFTKELLPSPKPNLTIEECRAITELKEDQSQMVLTAHKEWLCLSWTSRTIQTKPFPHWQTPVHTGSLIRAPQPNLSRHLKTSNVREDSVTQVTGKCIPLVLSPKVLWPHQNI